MSQRRLPRPTHYYVWYRVDGDVITARNAIDGILRDLAIQCGVKGRVLARRDDPRTWMEIYEQVRDTAAFELALAAAVQRHDATRFAEGGRRHAEPFVALA